MPEPPLRIEATRADLVESLHEVSVAVTNADGTLVASSGQSDLVSWWRSAAKPFQALPLVIDGGADRFGLGADALALACASHSSEPMHVALARQMMLRNAAQPHPIEAHRVESLAMFYTSRGDGKEGVASFNEKRLPAYTSSAARDMPGFYPWW